MMHRWLQIGRPERDKHDPGPDLSLLAKLPVASWGMEVSRTRAGQVDFRLTAPDAEGLNRVARVLEHTFPHVAVLGEAPCAAPSLRELEGWRFARARPHSKHHYWPLNIPEGNYAWATDYADTLVSVLGDPSLEEAEVRLQVFARQVGAWEAGLFSSRYEKLTLGLQGQHNTLLNGSWKSVPTSHDLDRLKMIESRHHTTAFHVEVRVAWRASPETKVLAQLRPWLDQWTSANLGGAWRTWDEVRPWPVAKHRAEKFADAFAAHDLAKFAARREARDVTAQELATMLAPPWRRDHAKVLHVPSAPPALAAHTWGRPHARPRAPGSMGAKTPPGPVDENGDSPFIAQLRRHLGVPPPPRRATPLPSQMVPPPGVVQAPPVQADAPMPVAPLPPPPPSPSWVLGRLAGIDLTLPEDGRHIGIVGGTGTGKSNLLLNLVLRSVEDPRPGITVVLDPTGALIRDIKARLPLAAARDTVEFDPAQLFFTQKGEEWVAPGFNFLDLPPEVRDSPAAFDRAASVTLSDLIRSFHDSWGAESVGAKSGYFMTALLKGLMKRPGTSLLDVRDIIINNKGARERYVRWLPPNSEFYGSFIEDELKKYRIEDFISTLDKTGWFSGSHLLRGALCQRDKPASFPKFLNHRLVLLNVSRGLVGNQNCKILGSAFLSMLWSERLAHGERAPPLTLVIDEAQTFALPSLGEMLSEGRKYGLRIVLANQYFGQLPTDLRSAMEGNVGVWCCFRTGPEDARAAHKVTQASRWDYAESRFTWLPDHQFVCNLPTRSNQGFWETDPPPPALQEALAVERTIRETVCKGFATREASEESPFLVDNSVLGPVVRATADGKGLREEIVVELGLPANEVFAALRRAEDLGYIVWDPRTKVNRVTELGQIFADAWLARRVTESEGEVHMDLLARAAEYLREHWGVEFEVTPQGSSPDPLPDGSFLFRGRRWVVEVECSTLATKVGQVLKNLEKAILEGSRIVFVVKSKEALERLQLLLPKAELELPEGEGIVVLFWDGRIRETILHPAARVAAKASAPEVAGNTASSSLPPPAGTSAGSDVEVLGRARSSLLAKGIPHPTAPQFVQELPEDRRADFLDPETGKPTRRFSRSLKKMGIVSDNEWDKETKRSHRVYPLVPGARQRKKRGDEVPPGIPAEAPEEAT